MKKNTSDIEMRKVNKHARRFYEKPRCVEVQLMADQALTGCNLQSGDNAACNVLSMNS